METLKMSLRQRKIMYMIEKSSSFVTSRELAEKMKVSSRTIRNDIHEINSLLLPYKAQIRSVQSKGFYFQAEDPDYIREISRTDAAVFSRSERIRYLKIRLCRSEEPLNLYELEEEVFVSHTALMADIRYLQEKCAAEPPFINLNIRGDEVSFEQDEEKIRSLLLNIFHMDWDYTVQENAFYKIGFLDRDLVPILVSETNRVLYAYDIWMDDATIAALQLLLCVMHDRVVHGHIYPEKLPAPDPQTNVGKAVLDLFDRLQMQTHIVYPVAEKARICQFIQKTQIQRTHWTGDEDYSALFPEHVKEEVSGYLSLIQKIFQVDFSSDMEFVHVLHVFFRQLYSGDTLFSHYQNPLIIKNTLTAEIELAYLYQRRAVSYIGRFLSDSELCTLAVCFSGAIRQYLHIHPEKKLRAVLFSHGNFAAAFGLKRRILESFDLYLSITDIAPFNYACRFDLADTELIFSTQRSKTGFSPEIPVVYIDDHPGVGFEEDARRIKLMSFRKIWPLPPVTMEELLEQAIWVENEECSDPHLLLQQMVERYIGAGIAGQEHLRDILQRETVNSFAIKPGLVFVYTLLPAAETRMEVVSLKHRIRWNDFKISTVVMAMFREEDRNLLFQLKIRYCNESVDPDRLKRAKKKEELIDCLK